MLIVETILGRPLAVLARLWRNKLLPIKHGKRSQFRIVCFEVDYHVGGNIGLYNHYEKKNNQNKITSVAIRDCQLVKYWSKSIAWLLL
jgi:hypothetical protein